MRSRILFIFLVIYLTMLLFADNKQLSGLSAQDLANKSSETVNGSQELRNNAREKRQKENAIRLENKLRQYDSEGRKDTLTANILLKLYNFNRYSNQVVAIDYLNRALEIFRLKGLKKRMAATYNLLGKTYFSQEMYYLAMDNYFKCFELMQNTTDKGAYAYALVDIANTYFAQGIYDVPLVYYKKSAAEFQRINNKFGLAVAYNNIALVKRNTGQLDTALYYFNKALLLRQKMNNPFLISHSYNYIGVIYYKKKDYDKALAYFNQSIDTINKIKNIDEENRSVKAESYFNIGAVYTDQSKFDEAYKNYLNALVIYQSIKDNLMIARTFEEIGKLKSRQNKFLESVKYLEEGLQVASKNKYANEKRKIYAQLYDINMKSLKTEDALKYMKLYSDISDSINDKKLANKLTEVQIVIQTYSKEKDLEFLRQRNRELKRISLAIVLFLSVVIMFAVYYIHNRRKNEKRWKQLSNVTFEGVTIHHEGDIIDCNNRFLQILGIDRNEIKNKSILDFIHPDCVQEVTDKINTPHAVEYETIIVKKDGTTINVEILSRPSTFKGKNVRVAAMRDITQRKKTEIQLQKYTQELTDLNATKDKFFSLIAHDLKNPFSSIIGFSELLLEDLQAKDMTNIETYVGIINKSAKSTFDLLENLLEWSRSQTGRLTFNPESLSLETLMVEEIGVFKSLAMNKGIIIDFKKETDARAFADANLVKTILRNLVSNAIKFTGNDGKITLSLYEKSGMIEMCVKDTGNGISKENLGLLFRIDVSRTSIGTSGEKGTGLGLILCKEFAEKNGGKIWVESELGKGSSFYFNLPKAT